MRARVALVLSAVACAAAAGTPDVAAGQPTRAPRCGAEDAPTWTWSRCGNHRRGVIDLRTGLRVVVGPCAFRRLWLHGDADLSRASERMRGDWYAIQHGCD